jgi:hypothetical protein
MHKATHVIISSFYRDNRGVAETFARPFGIGEKVPSSWGRPKASDINPTGTGNGNPLDQAERLIDLVYPHDPARAREMAENFTAQVDDLDRQSGIFQIQESQSPSSLLAKSICEHSDVAAALLNGDKSTASLNHALIEIIQAETALAQLKGAIEGLMANSGLGDMNA